MIKITIDHDTLVDVAAGSGLILFAVIVVCLLIYWFSGE